MTAGCRGLSDGGVCSSRPAACACWSSLRESRVEPLKEVPTLTEAITRLRGGHLLRDRGAGQDAGATRSRSCPAGSAPRSTDPDMQAEARQAGAVPGRNVRRGIRRLSCASRSRNTPASSATPISPPNSMTRNTATASRRLHAAGEHSHRRLALSRRLPDAISTSPI